MQGPASDKPRDAVQNAVISIVLDDDHPVVRAGLCDILNAEHDLRVVAEAGDGPAAIDMVRRHYPRIALLDVEMPGMSGLEVAEALTRERVPTDIILLTMYDHRGILERALELGLSGYLLKDSTPPEIVRGVRLAASGGRCFSLDIADHIARTAATYDTFMEQRLGLHLLSHMEMIILRLIAEESSTNDIAAALNISPRTVEKHRSHLVAKLTLTGPNALLRFALDNRKYLTHG